MAAGSPGPEQSASIEISVGMHPDQLEGQPPDQCVSLGRCAEAGQSSGRLPICVKNSSEQIASLIRRSLEQPCKDKKFRFSFSLLGGNLGKVLQASAHPASDS